jgi:hypothetical protein
MKTLGICWIFYGLYRVCMGVLALLLAPTATVMFGALLSRVPDPFTLMGTFHALYMGWIGLSFVCGALGILGGLAVTRKARDGRTLLLAGSFFSLSDLPVGIALSVYTLIVVISGVPIAKEELA